MNLADVTSCPVSISAAFEENFGRLLEAFDADPERYRRFVEPIAVSRKPLPIDIMRNLLGMSERQFLREVLHKCQLLVAVSDGALFFIHKTMYDWLTGKGEGSAAQAATDEDLGVDKDNGHRLLANFCIQNKDHAFALEHGVYHLIEAGQLQVAKEWVWDMHHTMDRIAKAPGGPVMGCAAMAADALLAEVPKMQRLVKLSTHALVQDPRQLAGQIVGRLGNPKTDTEKQLLEQAKAFTHPKGCLLYTSPSPRDS